MPRCHHQQLAYALADGVRMALNVLTLFGTRPEVIKLAPVLAALAARPDEFRSIVVSSGQHSDLLYPFIESFDIALDHDLQVMEADQQPMDVVHRVVSGLRPILDEHQPDMIVVQGDTATALAGAMAGFYADVPVGHVEAGLRSGNARSPFPEEMHRRLITQMTRLHFAATQANADALLSEGVAPEAIALTGNPVVDAVTAIPLDVELSMRLRGVMDAVEGLRPIVFTSHRRENLGPALEANMRVLRTFVETHPDTALLFPVHPNPQVRAMAYAVLRNVPRIHLLPPLEYAEFITLLSRAWLVVSDSGGVQEEAPTLGIPLLVMRDNTERPEAIDSGVARLVGGSTERLAEMLHEAYADDAWTAHVRQVDNPFGDGTSGKRIVEAIQAFFAAEAAVAVRV